MFQGQFDLALLDARGLADADFDHAIREGTLESLLAELRVEQRVRTKNRIFDNMAGYLLDALFKFPSAAWPYYLRDGGAGAQAALASIALLSTDGDTTSYTEDWGLDDNGVWATIHDVPDTVDAASAGKRFEEDQVSAWTIWADPNGREVIHFRNRFLYTPSQAVSANIRSVGLYFRTDGDFTGDYFQARALIGRVRLKNDAGVPIVINKTASNVLLVEYTFSLASV